MDPKKVASASKALKKYLKSHEPSDEKSQLFEDDGEFVYLVVKAKRFFAEERNLKPTLVELPTGLWSKRSEPPSVCVFVRDPQREYKDALLNGATPIQRAIGVSKLQGKFKPYEARRVLRADHDVFLAEDSVVPMLPKLLGKVFYGKQSYVPIALPLKTKEEKVDPAVVSNEVKRILNSTTLVFPASQTMLVRIGTTKHEDKELAKNAVSVVKHLGDRSLLSLSIKTNHSPTLPVWYADKIYSESDIGEHTDDDFETEGKKRARDEEHLDELLAELVDEDEIKEYNRSEKKRRKQKNKTSANPEAEEGGDKSDNA